MDLVGKVKDFVADKVADMPKPEATCTDVDLKDVSREGIEYLAKISIKNPYGVAIPISDIEYTLKSATRVIASGKVPDPGSLKASDTTMVDVHVKVPHSVLVSLIKDIAGDWDIDYEIEIKLIVDLPVIGNFTIPVNQKGEMKMPTWRDMFV
ncbi:hypothetical protein Leryth_004772 [Lithospermum erythrorhizon]|uniref:Water stress and hypersensitive response domain-containing protein n=1 Tax=Lithospermum erythrorhizon TaxID=34254 RepID=A0AAV3NKP7_LITER|nr:hypothetical protein Leryth_004772 [Lithospermum erythrorhizon]